MQVVFIPANLQENKKVGRVVKVVFSSHLSDVTN